MRSVIVLIVTFTFSINVKAQLKEQFRNKLLEEYKNKKHNFNKFRLDSAYRFTPLTPDLLKETPYSSNNRSVMKVPLKGTFLGNTNSGAEVYAMSTDNMPCLDPGKNFTSKMPVGSYKLGDNNSAVPLLKPYGDAK